MAEEKEYHHISPHLPKESGYHQIQETPHVINGCPLKNNFVLISSQELNLNESHLGSCQKG